MRFFFRPALAAVAVLCSRSRRANKMSCRIGHETGQVRSDTLLRTKRSVARFRAVVETSIYLIPSVPFCSLSSRERERETERPTLADFYQTMTSPLCSVAVDRTLATHPSVQTHTHLHTVQRLCRPIVVIVQSNFLATGTSSLRSTRRGVLLKENGQTPQRRYSHEQANERQPGAPG